MADQYHKVDVPIQGGIRQDVDKLESKPIGWWDIDGFHTNDSGALTKFTGLFENGSIENHVDALYQARLSGAEYKFAFGGGRVERIDPGFEGILASGLFPGIVDSRTLSNRVFFANGRDRNRKITADLRVSFQGIESPILAPTLTQDGGGAFSGTYSLRYSYYNSTDDIESDLSPAAEITVTSKRILLSNLQVSPDPQVDQKRIYRTVAGGGVWLRDEAIPNASTSYSLNSDDADLGAEHSQANGAPPIAKYMEVYNGMLLLAGLVNPNESTVAVSGVLLPESYDPDDIYLLDPEELDVITGIKKFGQSVAVGKRGGIYLGNGVHPAFMNFTRTRVTQGPLGNFTMVPYEGGLFYLSEKGAYVFGGLQETYLSRPIENIYKRLNLAEMYRATGLFYPNLNLIMWSVIKDNAANPNFLLAYNVITKEWTTRPINTTWMSTYLDTQDRVRWWLGGHDGKHFTGDMGHGDGGAPVTGTVITRGINFKGVSTANVKNYRHVFINYKPNGSPTPVEVSYAVDDPDGPYIAAGSFLPTTLSKARVDIDARGSLLFVKMTVTSDDPLVLQNVEVWGHDLGRIR
jgi:hypothetical protein